ncbi:MAG TPA: glycosyltransferase [Phycisphaerales bacterium]|nr:glycosyltransferase [Phycisphaerales bacterium]
MSTDSTQDTRPGLAIVAPTQERYRHALHRRIVHEIPEFRLHSIYTHSAGAVYRNKRPESDINAVFFDTGEPTTERQSLKNQFRNYQRGRKIFKYLCDNNIRAAIILGYNDIGLLHLFSTAHRSGVRLFLWADSNAAGDHATGLKRYLKNRIIRFVDNHTDFIFTCGSLGENFYRDYGVSSDKIRYSPCEPDYGLINTIGQESIAAVRDQYGLDPRRKRFVFCGRLVNNKRPDLALETFLKIADDRPLWDLVLIGDGPERSRLESMIPDILKHRVTFTGFLDDQVKVSAIYRICDILVHPCDYEPWGLIINEAAASGLAIITTSSCGSGVELVEDGKSGFLIDPGDAASLKNAMLVISKDDNAETFKARSRQMLQSWRHRADPVRAIRKALHDVGLLPDPAHTEKP